MRSAPRTHYDATPAESPVRIAACGWLDVDTVGDVAAVTCKSCRGHLTGKTSKKKPRKGASCVRESELHGGLAEILRAAPAAPTAPPPPRLTPALWWMSCRDARCGTCPICEWESEARRWAYADPWTRRHRLARDDTRPRWPSVDAALAAYAQWEADGRRGSSATGSILDRVREASVGLSQGGRQTESRLVRRATDIADVQKAIGTIYRRPNAAGLRRDEAIHVLLARTPNVLERMPTYEELVELTGAAGVGCLQRVVRQGRSELQIEMSARGLTPMPRKAPAWVQEAIESRLEAFEHAS